MLKNDQIAQELFSIITEDNSIEEINDNTNIYKLIIAVFIFTINIKKAKPRIHLALALHLRFKMLYGTLN